MIAAWWNGLQTRERRVLVVGGVLAGAMLLWGGLWQPLGRQVSRLQEQVDVERRELAWVRALAQVPATATAPAVRDRLGKSLLALVDASAREANLDQAMKRVEPIGARGVRASFDYANFDALMAWLEALARDYRVRITDLSVDKNDGNGLVSARVTLEDAS